MRRVSTVAFAFLLSLTIAASSFAASYPRPVGFVNDFANLLPGETKRVLEKRLRQYEKDTSIEVAVVTVSSLGGRSVEEYALGLFREWGVGKKQKNNGIILLLAPVERKVRIEVGRGMEPDLTDTRAGRIIREVITPLYRQKKIPESITAGVEEILLVLGTTPYETRLAERQAVREKETREVAEKAEQRKTFFVNAAIALGIGAIFLVCFVSFNRRRRQREALKTLYKKNAETFGTLEGKISEADNEYADTRTLFDELKRGNPKEIWGDFGDLISRMPQEIVVFRRTLAEVKQKHEKGWRNANEINRNLLALLAESNRYSSLRENIRAKIQEVEKAKKATGSFLDALPKNITKMKEDLRHPDVSAETKNLFDGIESKFGEARSLSEKSSVNWLLAYAALRGVASLLSQVGSRIAQDRTYAKEAREKGPELLKSLPKLIEKAKEAANDSDVSRATKGLAVQAEKKYGEAEKAALGKSDNWLVVFALLTSAATLANQVIRKVKEEVQEAEEERRKPRYVPVYSPSYPSSHDSNPGHSGGHDGDGGDFGGFGGGDSGGGGASGDL